MRNWWRKKERIRVQLRLDELVSNFSYLSPRNTNAFKIKGLELPLDQCSNKARSDSSTSEDSDRARIQVCTDFTKKWVIDATMRARNDHVGDISSRLPNHRTFSWQSHVFDFSETLRIMILKGKI
jgi:hypothetical protein